MGNKINGTYVVDALDIIVFFAAGNLFSAKRVPTGAPIQEQDLRCRPRIQRLTILFSAGYFVLATISLFEDLFSPH